ncbi:MAG: acyltransferase [Chloroflexota bacterium]|nr:acyltransferase [Chloroflexota bacterium]MDQ5865281.1 acyltransferase [Chloroflexota bacterium]
MSKQAAQTITKRQSSLKKRLKPLVAGTISRVFLAWYKLKYGKRVQFGKNFITNGKLVVKGPGKVIFGDNINAWCHAEKNVFITYQPETRITVGDGARISGMAAMSHSSITVGPRCMVASVIMVDTDFHNTDPVLRHDPDAPFAVAPIELKENVWVAGQTAILKGVTIGENSIVAFRAVVTKDVPANSIVAGNPARVVKEIQARGS